jgi:hypothetical protein
MAYIGLGPPSMSRARNRDKIDSSIGLAHTNTTHKYPYRQSFHSGRLSICFPLLPRCQLFSTCLSSLRKRISTPTSMTSWSACGSHMRSLSSLSSESSVLSSTTIGKLLSRSRLRGFWSGISKIRMHAGSKSPTQQLGRLSAGPGTRSTTRTPSRNNTKKLHTGIRTTVRGTL